MWWIVILFLFGFGSVFLRKKLGFSSEWVWFSSVWKTLFGSDIVVMYYICNTWLVNSQQKYYSVTVLCWMNCAITGFRSCFKTFFICSLNASTVISITFNLNCGLRAVSIGKQSVLMSNFLDGSDSVRIFEPNQILVFRTSLSFVVTVSSKLCVMWLLVAIMILDVVFAIVSNCNNNEFYKLIFAFVTLTINAFMSISSSNCVILIWIL